VDDDGGGTAEKAPDEGVTAGRAEITFTGGAESVFGVVAETFGAATGFTIFAGTGAGAGV